MIPQQKSFDFIQMKLINMLKKIHQVLNCLQRIQKGRGINTVMVGSDHPHVTEVGLLLLTESVTDSLENVTGHMREFPETDPMTDCPETGLLE